MVIAVADKFHVTLTAHASSAALARANSSPLSMSTPQQREQVAWLFAQPKTRPRKKSRHLAHRR